jgi:hypothetical protein
VDQFHLAQDVNQCMALANTTLKLEILKTAGNFLAKCAIITSSRRTLIYRVRWIGKRMRINLCTFYFWDKARGRLFSINFFFGSMKFKFKRKIFENILNTIA